MKSIERFLYDAIIGRIRNDHENTDSYISDIDISTKLRAGRIMRLRQCISNPSLLSSVLNEDITDGGDLFDDSLVSLISQYAQNEVPAKIDALIALVDKLVEQNQKILVWTNFKGTIRLICKELKKAGFICDSIDGDLALTSEDEIDIWNTREGKITRFLDPNSNVQVLVATLASCSESMSLHTNCSHAIYYDISYNCAEFLQSRDRIHRVGGSEDKISYYHFLEYENTIDQDIRNNLDSKENRMMAVIENDYEVVDGIDYPPMDDIIYNSITQND